MDSVELNWFSSMKELLLSLCFSVASVSLLSFNCLDSDVLGQLLPTCLGCDDTDTCVNWLWILGIDCCLGNPVRDIVGLATKSTLLEAFFTLSTLDDMSSEQERILPEFLVAMELADRALFKRWCGVGRRMGSVRSWQLVPLTEGFLRPTGAGSFNMLSCFNFLRPSRSISTFWSTANWLMSGVAAKKRGTRGGQEGWEMSERGVEGEDTESIMSSTSMLDDGRLWGVGSEWLKSPPCCSPAAWANSFRIQVGTCR